jgi:hypothetical protein
MSACFVFAVATAAVPSSVITVPKKSTKAADVRSRCHECASERPRNASAIVNRGRTSVRAANANEHPSRLGRSKRSTMVKRRLSEAEHRIQCSALLILAHTDRAVFDVRERDGPRPWRKRDPRGKPYSGDTTYFFMSLMQTNEWRGMSFLFAATAE